MAEVQEMIEFIKSEKISVADICKDLGFANGTIRLTGRGIPSKHIKVVSEHLMTNYGYNVPGTAKKDAIAEDNANQDGELKVTYNLGRVPGFKDGEHRFQNNDGLWLRVRQWGYSKGELHANFKPASEEIYDDAIGQFYIDVKGKKIYTKFNRSK